MVLEPKLSLVTGAMNRPTSLARLIRSIQDQTTISWELVVSDASDIPVISSDDRVRILPERPRLGCTKGYNRAFATAQGEWVIWLNDDAEVMPGYADAAIGFMEAHPEIGLGALHYADPIVGYHVSTCCYGMMYANFGIIRRTLGNQIGWFDEDLVMYGNDNSLAYRVLLAGYGIGEIHNAQIFHHAEDDALRMANQNGRDREASILKNKYGPYLVTMRTVYDQALVAQ